MPLSLIIIAHAVTLVIILAIFLPRRLRMERQARVLLAQYPNAERTSVYLKFQSALWSEKKKAMDDMISEMGTKGWMFLKASEANPLRTLRSLGGGLNMHFIRVRS